MPDVGPSALSHPLFWASVCLPFLGFFIGWAEQQFNPNGKDISFIGLSILAAYIGLTVVAIKILA